MLWLLTVFDSTGFVVIRATTDGESTDLDAVIGEQKYTGRSHVRVDVALRRYI